MTGRGRGRGGNTVASRYATQPTANAPAKQAVAHGTSSTQSMGISAAPTAPGLNASHSIDFLGPPPTFPQMDIPFPTMPADVEKECVEHAKALRTFWRDSPFYLTADVHTKDIERYSDMYQRKTKERLQLDEIDVNLDFFPAELQQGSSASRRTKAAATAVTENAEDRKRAFLKQLDLAERRANSKTNHNGEGAEEIGGDSAAAAEQEQEEEEVQEEEEEEEENDYVDTYFDNGEDYEEEDGGGDDEGATY